MITLYIFLTITAIEFSVIIFLIARIKQHNQNHINRIEKFFIIMYQNYQDMFYVLGVITLIFNGIVSSGIHLLYNLFNHII